MEQRMDATPALESAVQANSSRPVRTIALLNQKGGVGKTTTTVNLGAAIASLGRRVLLIDLDPQAHLTLHYGVEREDDEPSVYDLFVDPDCLPDEAILHARENVDLISAEVDLAAAEMELADQSEREQILSRKLKLIRDDYDYVLIDCPPSLGLLTLNALTFAREVIVPMQAHFLALQGVGKLLETVGLVCGKVNPALCVTGIVLCMHESNTTLAREVAADLDAFFAQARDTDVPWRYCRVLRPPIRRNIKLAEAPSFGNTIFDYAPWCPGANDYRNLATRLVAEWDALLERRGVARPDSHRQNPAPFEQETAEQHVSPGDDSADADDSAALAGIASTEIEVKHPRALERESAGQMTAS